MKTSHKLMGVAAMVAALAVPAIAGAGALTFDNQFQGRAERDPNTYVGFDVVKQNGVKKVAGVTAHLLYACADGGNAELESRVKGKLRIEDGRFAGTLRGTNTLTRAARGAAYPVKYRFAGRFLSKRKARGTIDATARLPSVSRQGPPAATTRCYTGKLDWRARKGAEVVIDTGPS